MAAPNPWPFARPVMKMRLDIAAPLQVGSFSRGTPLSVVPITGGRLESEDSYHTALDFAVLENGNDFVHYDPSGQHMRLNTRIVARSRDTRNDLLFIKYTGLIEVTSAMRAILGGSASAATTEFGTSVVQIDFETGCERYRALETGIFVAVGRFVIDEAAARIHVEYLVSEITSGAPVRDNRGAASTGLPA